MFKSKKFTVGFVILLILDIAALVVFLSLIMGRSCGKTSDEGVVASGDESLSTESKSEDSIGVAIMVPEATDIHDIPILNEIIPEKGILRIKDGAGPVVFHKSPANDDPNTMGNVINQTGGFDITGKKFILDNGKPILLYQTFDEYYVVYEPDKMTYTSQSMSFAIQDRKTLGLYGKKGVDDVLLEIFEDDGGCFMFSLYDGTSGEPILENVVARYETASSAKFEYKDGGGNMASGNINMQDRAKDSISGLSISFEGPVSIGGKSVTSVSLKK